MTIIKIINPAETENKAKTLYALLIGMQIRTATVLNSMNISQEVKYKTNM